MLNYEVDPGLLKPYVPPSTVLDSFQGRTYVSLVGFRFCHTKLFGAVSIPFHANFDEVNLRFYVRRKHVSDDQICNARRGVVFVAEVVPRRAIAATARLLYGENYSCLPMRHTFQTAESGRMAEYEWKVGNQWCKLSAQTLGVPARPGEGSLEQFITEHYWGYSSRRTGGCIEYHVSHVPWHVCATATAGFVGNATSLYGSDLGSILQGRPDSAFVADGSPVLVFRGNRIQ